MAQMILRGGSLVDAANGYHGEQADIAIEDGRICAIGDLSGESSMHELDVSGYTITPGLIDFHAHFYNGGTNTAVESYQYLSDGVTNTVDAGSAGDSNIESFISSLSERARRNVRLYMNLASEGLSCLGEHSENINPQFFHPDKIARLCRDHSDLIIGLKLRISTEIAELSGTTSFDSLRRAVEIADMCGLPLSVHMPNFQGELSELIDILRPGDIFCHVFTPQKGIIVDGEVSPEMRRAVEKGILLECACGKGHFGHDCAAAAFDAGIYPDILSGDFTRNTIHYAPAFSLPYLMTRFLALGIPFEKVLSMVTTNPACKMGMENRIGCLKVGAFGNLTVLERRQGDYSFTDVKGSTVQGTEMLVPMMTVLEGELVYRNMNTL